MKCRGDLIQWVDRKAAWLGRKREEQALPATTRAPGANGPQWSPGRWGTGVQGRSKPWPSVLWPGPGQTPPGGTKISQAAPQAPPPCKGSIPGLSLLYLSIVLPFILKVFHLLRSNTESSYIPSSNTKIIHYGEIIIQTKTLKSVWCYQLNY